MTQFYSAVFESAPCSSITVWFGLASKADMRRMQRTVRPAERIVGVLLPSLQDLYNSRVKKRAGNIIIDPSHPGHNLFALLPSGRRYRSLCTRTSRHKNCPFTLLMQCSTTKPQEHIHIFIYSCIYSNNAHIGTQMFCSRYIHIIMYC